MLQMFPLLAISLVVFAGLTVADVGLGETPWYDALIFRLEMYSGDPWSVTGGDVFLVGSMGLLFVELIRATKTETASIINHALSFTLFVGVLLVFLLAPGFGNSVFFLFMCMTFLDPMAGFVVTTVTARRDLAVADTLGR